LTFIFYLFALISVTHDILNELEVSRPSVTASNVNNSLLPSSTVGGLQAQSLLPDQFLYLCMVADMSPGLSVPVTVTGGSVTTGVGVGVISNEPPLIPPEMMYGTGQIGHHHLNVAGSLSVSSGTAGGSGGAVKMSQSRGTNSVNMIQQAGGKVGQVLDKAWNNFSAAVSKSKSKLGSFSFIKRNTIRVRREKKRPKCLKRIGHRTLLVKNKAIGTFFR
jgi:hypothetical protein